MPSRIPPQRPSSGARETRAARGGGASGPADVHDLEALTLVLQDLRLTPREAQVLVALVRLESATVSQLAGLVGMERANVYPILEGLATRRLAQRLAPPSERTWVAPGREEIVASLLAEEEERHRATRKTAERARELLIEIAPHTPPTSLPYLQVIPQVSEVGKLYDRLLAETQSELLVCNKAPFGGAGMEVRPSIIDALGRGVIARALYESRELDLAGVKNLMQVRLLYHEAGVEGRIVEHVPVRLAVFDRRRVLFAMNDSVDRDRFTTNIYVDNVDFAEFAALSFEQLWSAGRRWRRSLAGDAAAAHVGKSSRERGSASRPDNPSPASVDGPSTRPTP